MHYALTVTFVLAGSGRRRAKNRSFNLLLISHVRQTANKCDYTQNTLWTVMKLWQNTERICKMLLLLKRPQKKKRAITVKYNS